MPQCSSHRQFHWGPIIDARLEVFYLSEHQIPDLSSVNSVFDNEIPAASRPGSLGSGDVLHHQPQTGHPQGPTSLGRDSNRIWSISLTPVFLTQLLFICLKCLSENIAIQHKSLWQMLAFHLHVILILLCSPSTQLTSFMRTWPIEPSPKRPGQCNRHKGGMGNALIIPFARSLRNPLNGD